MSAAPRRLTLTVSAYLVALAVFTGAASALVFAALAHAAPPDLVQQCSDQAYRQAHLALCNETGPFLLGGGSPRGGLLGGLLHGLTGGLL
jgi:hypothetical protein